MNSSFVQCSLKLTPFNRQNTKPEIKIKGSNTQYNPLRVLLPVFETLLRTLFYIAKTLGLSLNVNETYSVV